MEIATTDQINNYKRITDFSSDTEGNIITTLNGSHNSKLPYNINNNVNKQQRRHLVPYPASGSDNVIVNPCDDLPERFASLPRTNCANNQNEGSEPIYQEIASDSAKLSNLKDDNSTKVREDDIKTSHAKNEIIYWKITAKEVAKFKPCNETFINRV